MREHEVYSALALRADVFASQDAASGERRVRRPSSDPARARPTGFGAPRPQQPVRSSRWDLRLQPVPVRAGSDSGRVRRRPGRLTRCRPRCPRPHLARLDPGGGLAKDPGPATDPTRSPPPDRRRPTRPRFRTGSDRSDPGDGTVAPGDAGAERLSTTRGAAWPAASTHQLVGPLRQRRNRRDLAGPAGLSDRARQRFRAARRPVLAGRPLPPAPTCVAIVGTRQATPDGRAIAFELGRDLAEAGICVVSGLALGIDGAAHAGALAAQGSAPPPGRPPGPPDQPGSPPAGSTFPILAVMPSCGNRWSVPESCCPRPCPDGQPRPGGSRPAIGSSPPWRPWSSSSNRTQPAEV